MSDKTKKKELNFDDLKKKLESCGYKLVSQEPKQISTRIEDEFVKLPLVDSYCQVLLEKAGYPKKWIYIASGSMKNEEFLKFLKEKWDNACLGAKIRDIDIDKLNKKEEE